MESSQQELSFTEWFRPWARDLPTFFTHPLRLILLYERADFMPDLMAGLTVAFVMLPQAIAYALIAGLPPETGLYAAIVATVVGALWGSSNHLHTGPTNTTTLVVFATLTPIFAVGSPEYVTAAAVMAVLVGVVRLMMGLFRLGVLVNFVADSVIVGFTVGAGILIGINQLKHLLRLEVEGSAVFLRTLWNIILEVQSTHLLSLGLGLLTVLIIVVIRKFKPKWPGTLISMIGVSAVVAFFQLDQQGVIVLGELPRTLPPFVFPVLSYDLIEQMFTGILAVSLIGLIEAMSIGQSIATQSSQRLDSDQEFVGQGLSNIAAGIFSGYTCSGSFTRSALNYDAGARTPMAAVISGIIVLILMLLFAPFAAYLPRTALAGIIILTAYRMVNLNEIRRIMRTSRGDTMVMYATLLATLFLPLQFAVLVGILVAFMRYVGKTSTPIVTSDVPDDEFLHFVQRPEEVCPQLGVITISGSLYFGATSHVESELRTNLEGHADQIYVLLRLHRVNHIDVSGINMLRSVVRLFRRRGGDVYLTGVHRDVLNYMATAGFVKMLGRDHILAQDEAIGYLFHNVLDPAHCIYRCPVRVWHECQTLPKSDTACELPLVDHDLKIEHIAPLKLQQELEGKNPPLLFDVRERAEYRLGHIAEAKLFPLPEILSDHPPNTDDRPVVLVCRSGRRSMHAARSLYTQTGRSVRVLDGGMLAWGHAGMPEVID